MKQFFNRQTKLLGACLAVGATAVPVAALFDEPAPLPVQTKSKGTAVAYPWAFVKGTNTARTTALRTAEEVARKAGFATIPGDIAKSAWTSKGYAAPTPGSLPTASRLRAYGQALKAQRVVYGSVSWHTRSIWVNLGPKTISTATVSVYVFDVNAGKVVYKRTNVQGRSDEKSNGLKVAGAILISPLVTAVSGGPATPQEQRAVQIALALAYKDWVMPGK